MFRFGGKKVRSLFGMELVLNPALRDALLSDKTAIEHRITKEFLNSMEDGAWDEISYLRLFFLTAKAEELKIPCFTLVSGGLWDTFHNSSFPRRLLIGRNRKGKPIAADMACAQPFLEAFDPDFDMEKGYGREKILDFMANENLILIGGSKVNDGTRVALEIFKKKAGVDIAFSWPDFNPTSDVESSSTDGRRHLRVGSHRFSEGADGDPAYGLVAACRNPMGNKKNVTTLVIAGCSAHATRLMSEEIQKPSFTRLYDPRWDKLDGHPVFFVFEKRGDKCVWKVIGEPARTKRRTGRPPRKQK
jgi:hypothetical protein